MGQSPSLLQAVAEGHVETVAQLLQDGRSPDQSDAYGRTALLLALVSLPRSTLLLDILRLLCAHGANVHAQDARGCTALHYAAQKGYLEAITLLLEHRANPLLTESYGRLPMDFLPPRDRICQRVLWDAARAFPPQAYRLDVAGEVLRGEALTVRFFAREDHSPDDYVQMYINEKGQEPWKLTPRIGAYTYVPRGNTGMLQLSTANCPAGTVFRVLFFIAGKKKAIAASGECRIVDALTPTAPTFAYGAAAAYGAPPAVVYDGNAPGPAQGSNGASLHYYEGGYAPPPYNPGERAAAEVDLSSTSAERPPSMSSSSSSQIPTGYIATDSGLVIPPLTAGEPSYSHAFSSSSSSSASSSSKRALQHAHSDDVLSPSWEPVPPDGLADNWSPVDYEFYYQQVRLITRDMTKLAQLKSVPETFSLVSFYSLEVAKDALEHDPLLVKARRKLVPAVITELGFWITYFYQRFRIANDINAALSSGTKPALFFANAAASVPASPLPPLSPPPAPSSADAMSDHGSAADGHASASEIMEHVMALQASPAPASSDSSAAGPSSSNSSTSGIISSSSVKLDNHDIMTEMADNMERTFSDPSSKAFSDDLLASPPPQHVLSSMLVYNSRIPHEILGNASLMRQYQRLVPSSTTAETFWANYFYFKRSRQHNAATTSRNDFQDISLVFPV